MQGSKEIWKLLFRPIQHLLRKQSAAWAKFQNFNLLRRSQHPPHLVELPGQQPPEDRVHIARSVEISCLAELFSMAGVITELGIVEAHFHVPRKRNRPAFADFLLNFLSQSHRPFRRRSARSWGVRTNISTR